MSNERCQMCEGIPTVAELVLLHNRCHTVPAKQHLEAFMNPHQVPWNLKGSLVQEGPLPEASSWDLDPIPHLMSRRHRDQNSHTWFHKQTPHKWFRLGIFLCLFVFRSFSFESIIIMESQTGRLLHRGKLCES